MSKHKFIVGYPKAEMLMYYGGKDTSGRRTTFVPMTRSEAKEIAEEMVSGRQLVVYKLVPVENVWPKESE